MRVTHSFKFRDSDVVIFYVYLVADIGTFDRYMMQCHVQSQCGCTLRGLRDPVQSDDQLDHKNMAAETYFHVYRIGHH